MDSVLFRITVYEVVNNELRYIQIFSYKNPPSYFLYRIYVTEAGNYAVFNQTEGFQTPENRFFLYRLNENFGPAEQLLEMPGNDRRRVDYPEFTLFMPSDFLSKTFWDLDGEWFCYITSYQPSINKYNLRSGDKEVVSIFQFQERLNNSDYTNFLKEHYDFIKDEQHWAVLENSKKLPLFSGFWELGEKIILKMFYSAEENGMMVFAEPDAEEIKYFRIPHELNQLSLQDGTIYSIDFNIDGNYQLMFIDLILN